MPRQKTPNTTNLSPKKSSITSSGEASTNESRFVIPRKRQETSLCQDVSLDSREFKSDILPVLKRNNFRPPQHSDAVSFRYTKCTLINNVALLNKFDEKRRELKQEKIDTTISFGFWQTFSQDEIRSICDNGLTSNYPLGSLGNPDLGVYVVQYADVPTAAPLMDGICGTIIIFKILKGRVKPVPVFNSGHLEPTPNYECHAAKVDTASTAANVEKSSYYIFESSLLYLYDYLDVDLQSPPRNVCPIAIVDYVYENRRNSPRWLKSEATFWTGSLCFDKGKGKGNCDYGNSFRLVSHLAKMKPPYLGPGVLIKKLTTMDACTKWGPVKELCNDSTQGTLYKQRRDLHLSSGHYITVYKLVQNKWTEQFSELIASMYKHKVVGLSALHEGTSMLFFPASHFSCQLGIPAFAGAPNGLYCLVLSFRSMVTGIGFVRDVYENASRYEAGPTENYICNPKKLLQVTTALVKQYPPPEIEPPPATEPAKDTADQPASSSTESFAIPEILLRDPRYRKRIMEAAQKGPTSDADKQPIVHSVVGGQKRFLSSQPVDLEEPSSSSDYADEPRAGSSRSFDAPNVVSLSMDDDLDSSVEIMALPSGKEASTGHGQGESRSSVNKLDNHMLRIIYGKTKKKRLYKTKLSKHGRMVDEDEEEDIDEKNSANFEQANSPTNLESVLPEIVNLDDDNSQPSNETRTGTNPSSKGFVVPDDFVLIRAEPEQVKKLLEYFVVWKNIGLADWKMKLHSQVVSKLARITKNLASTSSQHLRVTAVLSVISEYYKNGVVQLLDLHECDRESRSAAEYLPCLQQLKLEADCILLSNMNQDSDAASGFRESGILVMNLQTLTDEFLQLKNEEIALIK